MLKNTLITKKFPLVMISFAIISAIATGIIAFTNAKNSLTTASEDKIISLLESRKSSLNNYIETIKNDVDFHAHSPLIISALNEFSKAWNYLPDNKTQYLQDAYINNNPFTVGQKGALLSIDDGTKFNEVHRKYHPIFRNLIGSRSFYDIFLFNTQGDLIYTVIKEDDFAENLVTGQWSDTGLARMFAAINDNPSEGKQIYIDFERYSPSEDKPASFIGTAIFDEQHNYIGVLGFQLSIKPIDEIMQVTAGMGKTGETYLVGADLLMRSDSRFFSNSSILKIEVNTRPVRQALQGEHGISIMQDYRGIPVFSAYTPIKFFNANWVMLAEIDKTEVMAPVYEMSHFLLISGILLVIVIAFIGYLLAYDISNPIVTMTETMKKLAKNELDTNISVSTRNGEVGSMADALVIFKQNALERDALHKKMSHLANHDALTELPTRKYAMEQLDVLLEESRNSDENVALMFIDLDNFKIINDTYGHSAGDRVLKEVASQLRFCINDDDIVARLGGDEFIVIIPNVTNTDRLKKIANNILHAIKNNISDIDEDSQLSASIGVSLYPNSAKDGASLLKQADEAMYKAKFSGKNSFYISFNIDSS